MLNNNNNVFSGFLTKQLPTQMWKGQVLRLFNIFVGKILFYLYYHCRHRLLLL